MGDGRPDTDYGTGPSATAHDSGVYNDANYLYCMLFHASCSAIPPACCCGCAYFSHGETITFLTDCFSISK